MDILNFPNSILFEKMPQVTVFGEELQILLDSMWDTMNAHNGVGLAANQVGLSLNAFVMKGPNGRLDVINPLLIAQSAAYIRLKEGCLSAPGTFIILPRPEWVHLKYKNEKGQCKLLTLKDLYSVCAIHEMEHLNGESFLSNKNIPKNIRKNLNKKWGIK